MSRSASLFKAALKVIPGGVNSPVRAFRAVGGSPVVIKKGRGAFLYDEDGKRYLDFCASWGALLFGHAPASLLKTLRREIGNGTSFGAATAKEIQLAQKLCAFFPSLEKVRLVSSGTEAVMSAVRLARGFTGRKKILKIDGGYHGHADSLLVKAGSGGATFGVPDSAGVPEEIARHTISIPFNDLRALESVFKKEGGQIAAFILEPVPANMGVVMPRADYLMLARMLTKREGALLIFDEVITGFRLPGGGAQQHFNVRPDLTCLGKILGSGLPIAAFGGRGEIMDKLSPLGPVYQAGTLSGNPVAVTAALWVMAQIGVREKINSRAKWFYEALKAEIQDWGGAAQLNHASSMFTLFFSQKPVTDYASAKESDTKRYAKFFRSCLGQGVYLAPSQFEANFLTAAHSDALLNQALRVFRRALKLL